MERLGHVACIILFTVVVCEKAGSQSFLSLGNAPGASSYSVSGVSENGSVCVGQLVYAGDSAEAFQWIDSTGFTGLGDLPGHIYYSGAMGVSGDGEIVAGWGVNSNQNYFPNEPFRWTQATGLVGLGYPPGADTSESIANNISTDGSTIVGNDSTGGWIWRNNVFTRIIGSSNAKDISSDGSVVVGVPTNGGVYRWTPSSGLVILDASPTSIPYGVSADGNTIVGSMGPGFAQAFRWTQATGMVGLGRLSGHGFSVATDVSEDGSTIIGRSYGPGSAAFIWREQWGHMVALRDFLEDSLELVLPGWDLGVATDINDEGDYIVGWGAEGWRAHVPYLAFREPTSGDKWIAGTQDTVRWWKSGVDTVDIFLSVDFDTAGGVFDSVVKIHPAEPRWFAWDIPDSILSKKCALRIVSKSDSTFADTSEVFKIKGYILTRDSSDQYEPFRFGQDRWRFGNDSSSMWPLPWYRRFNYEGTDPFTGLQYGFQIPFRLPFSLADSSDFPDWPLFVQTFGVDECYWSTALGIYTLSALLKWGILKDQWGGSCFGFAVSSLVAFDDSAGFNTAYPVIPPYRDLFSVVLDTAVRKVVNELWIHQFGDPHARYISSIWNTKTPTQTVQELKQILLSDTPDPAALVFWNNNGSGGHAVTPFRVRYDTSLQVYWIDVYDNSRPTDTNASIWVDTAGAGGGDWGYSHLPGWGGLQKLIVGDPVSSYLSKPTLSPSSNMHAIVGQEKIEVYPSLDAEIQIRNPSGQLVGYADSMVFDGIPGATPFIPATGSETPPYWYLLPPGSYSVEMDNFTKSKAQLAIFTDSVIFAYHRQDASLNQTDLFTYDGSLSFRNQDAQQKVATFTAAILEDTTAEKGYAFLNCPVSQNDSLHLRVVDHDDFSIANFGGGKSYGLSIERTSRTSNPRFYNPVVNLATNSTHWIVPDWTDLQQPIPVYIDLGNNGTIDDTIFVNNTVSVDDQGSLFLPREYNLAQNYPNPFNPFTNIRYALPQESHVRLTIYNILGQEVVTLVDEPQPAGHHALRWEGKNAHGVEVGSGVYLYKMEAYGNNGERFVETRKMLLVK